MYELGYAENMAARLIAVISDECERVLTVGSIRRRRTQVKDIDLVVIPTSISALGLKLIRMASIEFKTKKRLSSDTKIIDLRFHSIPVQIYIANKETWPMLLLVRTGSKEHNQHLAHMAKLWGKKFKANGEGILDADGNKISGDTEESIFEALGLEWVSPEERE